MNVFNLLAQAFAPVLEAIFTFVNNVIPMPFMMTPGRSLALSNAIFDTLHMLLIPGFIAFVIGLVAGVILVVCKQGGILENKVIHFIFDKVVNFFRSLPFVISIGLLLVLSRFIMGTGSGVKGMYIPLIFSAFPFIARQVESSLSGLDGGLIEASIAMGCKPIDIILRVYLKESIASIARGMTITYISLIGIIAMAGVVGAGGIGDFAIRFGWKQQIFEATVVSVVIILIIVSIVQWIGNYIAKKTTH